MHVHDHQPLVVLRQHVDAVQLRHGVAHWGNAATLFAPLVRSRVGGTVAQFPCLLFVQEAGEILPACAFGLEAKARLRGPGGWRHRGKRGVASRVVAGADVAQHLRQLAEDEVVDVPRTPKAHFVLGRMDVHVHKMRRQFQEQREHRVASVEEHVSIRLAHGVAGEPVAHRAAVDEEVLARGAGVRVGRQADPPPQPHVAAGFVHRHRFRHEAFAEERTGAGIPVAASGKAVQGTRTRHELEAHCGIRKGDAPHRLLDVQQFRALGLQELAAGRRVVEQLGHFHRGAERMRRGAQKALFAACHLQGPCAVRTGGAGEDRQIRNRGGAGQGFAAKAEGGHRGEVASGNDLAGGVARNRQAQVFWMDAAAVVAYADAPHAGLFRPPRGWSSPRRPGCFPAVP